MQKYTPSSYDQLSTFENTRVGIPMKHNPPRKRITNDSRHWSRRGLWQDLQRNRATRLLFRLHMTLPIRDSVMSINGMPMRAYGIQKTRPPVEDGEMFPYPGDKTNEPLWRHDIYTLSAALALGLCVCVGWGGVWWKWGIPLIYWSYDEGVYFSNHMTQVLRQWEKILWIISVISITFGISHSTWSSYQSYLQTAFL